MNREIADNYMRAAMTRTYFPGQGLTVATLDTTYDLLIHVRAAEALAELDEYYPRPTATDLFVVARTHGVPVAVLVDAYDARVGGALTEIGPDYREPCQACEESDPVPGEDHCQACLNVIYGPLIDDDETGGAK